MFEKGIRDVSVWQGKVVELEEIGTHETYYVDKEVYDSMTDHFNQYFTHVGVLEGYVAENHQAENGETIVGVFDTEEEAWDEIVDMFGNWEDTYTENRFGVKIVEEHSLEVVEASNGFYLYG